MYHVSRMFLRCCLIAIVLMPIPLNTRALAQSAEPKREVARIAEMRPVHEAFQWFFKHESDLRKLQIELAVIPAPPFGEVKRAEWLKGKFTAFGLQDIEIDKAGNVLGVHRGTDGKAKVIALTAHIDTVFPADTPLNIRSEGSKLFGPGVSDNGAGVTALLAVVMELQEGKIKHKAPILFVGNVGEEGEGDLRGIRYLFQESKWKDKIDATIVLDGAGTDSIVTQALGSKRFEVTIHGPGGHSWTDFGTPNPIVAMARAIARFSESPVPSEPKTSFNVGVISGGTSVNSIPESATIRVDIRSAAPAEIEKLEKALHDSLDKAVKESDNKDARGGGSSRKSQLSYEMKVIGTRPAAELKPESRILAVVRAVDMHLSIKSQIRRASTDANIPLSLGREAVSIGAGGTGDGAHTIHEWFDANGRDLGLKRVLLDVLTLAGVGE